MNVAYRQALGSALENRRHAQRLTKSQLALMVGLSRLTIRRVETGEANPTLDVLLRICGGLGVPFSEVVAECERSLSS